MKRPKTSIRLRMVGRWWCLSLTIPALKSTGATDEPSEWQNLLWIKCHNWQQPVAEWQLPWVRIEANYLGRSHHDLSPFSHPHFRNTSACPGSPCLFLPFSNPTIFLTNIMIERATNYMIPSQCIQNNFWLVLKVKYLKQSLPGSSLQRILRIRIEPN